MEPVKVRFAAVGMNHDHIYGMTNLLLRSGGELASFYAAEPDLAARYAKAFPQARQAASEQEVLEDPSVQMVMTSAIPNERAPLAIRAMRHGKDVLVDKPGCTTFEDLEEMRRTQAETRRICSIYYAERLENAATIKAAELIRQGAIGRVVQTIGTGPHMLRHPTRPPWFFVLKQYGGILVDIASHQVDQFLYVTGSQNAEIVKAQVANFHYPQFPELEDFGDILIRGDGGGICSGYIRVDWFTPDGLGTWGDARLIAIGTEGYIEVRKYIDIAGRPGGNHLILVDKGSTQYIDCNDVPVPFGRQLLEDVVNRTETAMSQRHCFLVAELALRAEMEADRLGHLAARCACGCCS